CHLILIPGENGVLESDNGSANIGDSAPKTLPRPSTRSVPRDRAAKHSEIFGWERRFMSNAAAVAAGPILTHRAVDEHHCARVGDAAAVTVGAIAAHRAVGKSQCRSVIEDAATCGSPILAHRAVGKSHECEGAAGDTAAGTGAIAAHRAV